MKTLASPSNIEPGLGTAEISRAAGDLELKVPHVESEIRLEKLLPEIFWKKMQADPVAKELAGRIDKELLAPLNFDRENLTGIRDRLRGSEALDREQLRDIRGFAQDCLQRIGDVDHQLTAEIKRGPDWAKATLEQLRRNLVDQTRKINHELNVGLRVRHAGLPQEIAVLTPAHEAAEVAHSDRRPFVRLRENPLRDAVADCTFYVAGMPSVAMAESLARAVSHTLPPNTRTDSQQSLASHNTGEHSSVAPGYFGPSVYPDPAAFARKLQSTYGLNAADTARANLRLDASTLSAPIGIIDIAVREPGKIPGPAAWFSRFDSTAHRNVEITFIGSNEIENRGHARVSDRSFIIGMNIAVPAGVAAKIQNQASKGNGMEILRDLFEAPPPERAGEIVRWIRSGIVDPLLAERGQKAVTWDRATNAQKNRAFELLTATHDGQTFGEFSSKLRAFCREFKDLAA